MFYYYSHYTTYDRAEVSLGQFGTRTKVYRYFSLSAEVSWGTVRHWYWSVRTLWSWSRVSWRQFGQNKCLHSQNIHANSAIDQQRWKPLNLKKKLSMLSSSETWTIEINYLVYSNEQKITGRWSPKDYEKWKLLYENQPLINNQPNPANNNLLANYLRKLKHRIVNLFKSMAMISNDTGFPRFRDFSRKFTHVFCIFSVFLNRWSKN